MNPEELNPTQPTTSQEQHAPMLHYHEGTGTPYVRLRDVRGGFRVAASDPIDDTGAIYFNSVTGRFRGFDGTTWYNIAWTTDAPLTKAPIEMGVLQNLEGNTYITAKGGDQINLGANAIGNYYKFDINWDAPNNRIRAQIDGGGWSNWVYPDIAWDGINGVRFSGKGDAYYDDLSGKITNTIEGYTLDVLDGQDGWSGSTVFSVTTTNPNGGTQCIFIDGNDTVPRIDKSFTLASTGTQTVYMRHESNAAGITSFYTITWTQ
jgi:hypothetical protein